MIFHYRIFFALCLLFPSYVSSLQIKVHPVQPPVSDRQQDERCALGNIYISVLQQFRRQGGRPTFVFEKVFSFLNLPVLGYNEVMVGQWFRIPSENGMFRSCKVIDKWNDKIAVQWYEDSGLNGNTTFSKQQWDTTCLSKNGRLLDLSTKPTTAHLRLLLEGDFARHVLPMSTIDRITAAIVEHSTMKYRNIICQKINVWAMIQLYGLDMARGVASNRYDVDGGQTPWEFAEKLAKKNVFSFHINAMGLQEYCGTAVSKSAQCYLRLFTAATWAGWVGVLKSAPLNNGVPKIHYNDFEYCFSSAPETNQEAVFSLILKHGKRMMQVNAGAADLYAARWHSMLVKFLWQWGRKGRLELLRILLSYGKPFEDARFYWKLFGGEDAEKEFGNVPSDHELLQWIKSFQEDSSSTSTSQQATPIFEHSLQVRAKVMKFEHQSANLLHWSCRNGFLGLVKLALRRKDLPNDELSPRLLMHACVLRHWPMVQFLLEIGIPANNENGEYITQPLPCALSRVYSYFEGAWNNPHDHLKIIQALLDNGARVDDWDDESLQTTIPDSISAIKPASLKPLVVRMLLEAWTKQHQEGHTHFENLQERVGHPVGSKSAPLYMAVDCCNIPLVRVLLQAGAQVDTIHTELRDTRPETVLNLVCRKAVGSLALVKVLSEWYEKTCSRDVHVNAIRDACMIAIRPAIQEFLQAELIRLEEN